MTNNNDSRLRDLGRWLESEAGLSIVELAPASSDASFRRYFRVETDHGSFVAMDAPPQRENSEPFLRIASYLRAAGVNSPHVIRADPDQGFLLLTDLGKRRYLDELRANPECMRALYTDAIAALLRIQQEGREYQSRLPPYDRALLTAELALFRDWLCARHLEFQFSARERRLWRAASLTLVENALQQPRVFVHRDYHSRNLMVCYGDNPGILDFQDAVEGPYTYDLVSLLKDCYVRWPTHQVRDLALDFFRRLPTMATGRTGEEAFLRSFDLMGVQRHLKAAGIFARLNHRDGKPDYMADVPRTLGYIVELAPRYPELEFLGELIETRCLPALDGSLSR